MASFCIEGELDKEYKQQKQKGVIRVDKLVKQQVLHNVWIQNKRKTILERHANVHEKPNIRWFEQNMNLDFPTSNHLHHPFHIRRAPIPTIGMPWPRPQTFETSDTKLYKIRKLSVKANFSNCHILQKAVQRYMNIFFTCSNVQFTNNLLHLKNSNFGFSMQKPSYEYLTSLEELRKLTFDVERCSNYPTLSSDESYTLRTSNGEIRIEAKDVWGTLRALETLSQLIICISNTFIIRKTRIVDFPRFPHRGILIDSARHFMSKTTIFQMLSAMEMNKINVFHWHLSDDQSFPYRSRTFPDLSGKGAYHPSLTYTQEDVKEIIEFARIRGIRVIPEFDTPGHSFSWGFGHPELLTQCYNGERPIPGDFGPMNPARNSTYTFLSAFFKEVLEVFKDQYVHLGNDEVPLACWNTNREVRKLFTRIKNTSMFKDKGTATWSFFTERLIKDVQKIAMERENGVKFILWQEAYQSNLNIPRDTIVQVWLGDQRLVEEVARQGYHVLYSSCWYINMIQYGVVWPKYYLCDPIGEGFRGKEDLVLGGEACLWSEYVTSETAIGLLWPKASAVAERLWSDKSLRDIDEAARRLEEHRCRMLRRGLTVGDISGPGFCAFESEKPSNLSEHIFQSQVVYSAKNQGIFKASAALVVVGMVLITLLTCTATRIGCFKILKRLVSR
ncbi:beta-hexosaminidase subunit alpha-like [Saccostrea cucullata]|uniref:beta-hexosaminidase subunit alpha-like n=1 Tax=Saccostrea cuccullata TaxID=36930 RepID=UPI002ED3BB37